MTGSILWEIRRCEERGGFTERLARVEGGCDLAFGAYCREDSRLDGNLELIAMIEHDGELIAAKSHGKEPRALVAMAWEGLQDL